MPYRYFPDYELACKCGECNTKMDEQFMAKLIALREHLGFPFPVTSAARCSAYNSKVSSTGETGPHTTGRAVDIQVYGDRAFAIVAAAEAFGFTGIGIKQKGDRSKRFIHLDDLAAPQYPRPWVWSY